MGKNLVTGGGVMQLSNDTSKNITSPPYLVKNERSLSSLALWRRTSGKLKGKLAKKYHSSQKHAHHFARRAFFHISFLRANNTAAAKIRTRTGKKAFRLCIQWQWDFNFSKQRWHFLIAYFMYTAISKNVAKRKAKAHRPRLQSNMGIFETS